jgi:two-component system cell cycle response regulator
VPKRQRLISTRERAEILYATTGVQPLVPSEDSKPTLLLIDDSIDVHRLLTARLKHEPVDILCASNGPEALDKLRSATAPPACILLDLDMPSMDGFEILRTLKEDQAFANIPVVVLSGLVGSEDKVAAIDLGAIDYVTKPFDMPELRARLRSALRLSRLLALLAERAEVDGLTGLANRANFNKLWPARVAEADRYNQQLSIAVLDLDQFKRVNDTYGHPAGDEVLQTFAQVVSKEIRKTDAACRLGGEEFAVVMPNTGPDEARQLAERIRAAMAATTFTRHPDHPVTVSIGIAGRGPKGPPVTPDQWFEMADKNLYAAKSAGRNRVICTVIGGGTAVPATSAA